MLSKTPVRGCGGCDVCCTLIAIPALNKPADTPCAHSCKQSGGCQVYEFRPEPCSQYRCSWLEGNFSEELRPDVSGLLFETTQIRWPKDLTIYTGFEAYPGAAEKSHDYLDKNVPAGSIVVVVTYDKKDVVIIGQPEDVAVFQVWSTSCQQLGVITCVMADGQVEVSI